jgi:protein-S-isoprenylcysteine O-methyltransferase Ste14
MNEPALLVILLNFSVIGLLPRVFFRKDGRLGPRWWAMALPFFLCPALLVGAYLTRLGPITPADWARLLAPVSVVFGVASIALISFTLGTHRIPIALWQQDNDAPEHIVTYGAYGRIRHPFYAAFLLAFLGALALFPHWATVAFLTYAAVGLNVTAAQEERRLSASEFGTEYRTYIAHTGRFLPRPTARAAGTEASA